jgi:hypothetical protein
MGQLLSVERLVTGSIVKFGNLYSLYVKIMSVVTGEILRNVNLELTVSMAEVLTRGIKQAVSELTQSREGSKKTEAFSLQNAEIHFRRSNLFFYSAFRITAATSAAWAYFLSKASQSYGLAGRALSPGGYIAKLVLCGGPGRARAFETRFAVR